MANISIFYATVNNVPVELEEQAQDIDKVIDQCRAYMNQWGVSASTLISDLDLILEGEL